MRTGNKMPYIYWLGGSTCAGKTTISNILSETYGIMVYHCDKYLGEHIEKSNVQESPNLNQVTKMGWNDILSMQVDEYLNWTISLFSEEFDMILEDLDKLFDGKPILVEGVDLLPGLIKNEMIDNHALWLVAEEAFYKEHQMQREELFDRLKECSDPEQALHNYMSYDLAFGKYVENDAKRLGLKVMTAEKDRDIMKNVEAIASYFKLA